VKTLHLYLTRQVIASLLMTVVVFTFVLLLGNVLKELLRLLVEREVTFGLLAKAVGLLIPFSWVYALPMGMLTATLLVFGRFSADQELTAARASGISLISLTTPILIFSLLLCGLCALVNMELGPRSRVAYKHLLSGIRAEVTAAAFPEDRFVNITTNSIIYVGKNHRGKLEDITIFVLRGETNQPFTTHAARGSIEITNAARGIELHLYDVRDLESSGWSEETTVWLPAASEEKEGKPALSDMTFGELRAQLRDLEKQARMRGPPAPDADPKAEARKRAQERLLTERVRVNLHRELAFSFACFGFTLVGIPLGIRIHRRETNIGVAMALLLVLVYECFVFSGQSLAGRPGWPAHLFMWAPNFLFQGVGAVLLWRANRGV
jgi:lipopolysaccharide export system permease protein